MLVEPIYRGILAADIEGFGRLERSNPVRVHLRAALHRLIDQSLTQAGIEPWHREQSDHGDCVLILLEPQVPKMRLLDSFVPKLAAALARHNRRAPTAERLRLRVVVHAGEILRDAHGHSGEDLNTAFRLLDSEPLHACLAQAVGDLAVIVSDAIYQAIVKHGYRRIDPAGYHAVTVVAKETNARAWIHAPQVTGRTPPQRAARTPAPPPATVRQEGPVPTVPPAQLPGDVASFTGRRRELRRLRDLLASTGRRPAAVVSAIHGIGGVGKSALALRAAHALAAQFPDGQLYVDLRGSSVSGLSPPAPEEAIGRLLRALGPDGESVPVGLEEAVARFRSLLAGRRVLVVLDNAASAAQVRPLLPAVPTTASVGSTRPSPAWRRRCRSTVISATGPASRRSCRTSGSSTGSQGGWTRRSRAVSRALRFVVRVATGTARRYCSIVSERFTANSGVQPPPSPRTQAVSVFLRSWVMATVKGAP